MGTEINNNNLDPLTRANQQSSVNTNVNQADEDVAVDTTLERTSSLTSELRGDTETTVDESNVVSDTELPVEGEADGGDPVVTTQVTTSTSEEMSDLERASTIMEDKFLDNYTKGQYDSYDPRAVVLAGEMIKFQTEENDQHRRDDLAWSTEKIGLNSISRGTSSQIVSQASEILNGIEVDGVDTSAQFEADMSVALKPDGDATQSALNMVDDKLQRMDNYTVDDVIESLRPPPPPPRSGDPLILDLDGDGIELTSIDDGTYFDLDGDGSIDEASWIESDGNFDDAFLALDRNGDGEINSGRELFGDQYGEEHGYAELAKLDSNDDGVIDTKDDIYKDLKLWADMDKDGQVGEGELRTLEEMGVKSISLETSGEKGTDFDEHGNDISFKSTFVREVDGVETVQETVSTFFQIEGEHEMSLDDVANLSMDGFEDFRKDASVNIAKADFAFYGADFNGEDTSGQEISDTFVEGQIDSKLGELSSLNSEVGSKDVAISQAELDAAQGASVSISTDEVVVSTPAPAKAASSGENQAVSDANNTNSSAPRTETVETVTEDSSAADEASARASTLSGEKDNLSSQASTVESEISFLRSQLNSKDKADFDN